MEQKQLKTGLQTLIIDGRVHVFTAREQESDAFKQITSTSKWRKWFRL